MKFLAKLIEGIEKFTLNLYCYVLMDNHYHLFLQTPNPNLCQAMHHLNSSYSNWINKKYQIVGSIFQGRYKSIIVDSESYALSLNAYIHLNPVRSGYVSDPTKYKWSSYNDYIGQRSKPEWINFDFLLDYFSGNSNLYIKFVHEWGRKTNYGHEENMFGKNSILGNDQFEEKIKIYLNQNSPPQNQREISHLKQLICLSPETLKEILDDIIGTDIVISYDKKWQNLYQRIYFYGLHRYSNLQIKDIGKLFNKGYSATSESIRRLSKETQKNDKLKNLINQFDKNVKKYLYK